MHVKQIVYLVHSGIYKVAEAQDLKAFAAGNQRIYRERERRCEQRWRDALETLSEGAVFAMLYGDRDLFETSREILGADRAFWVSADWSPEVAAEEYRERLAGSLTTQLASAGYSVDSETTRLEVWGASFEGCVYDYGSALARHLQLRVPPAIEFEMCVPDARFLCDAKVIDRFGIAEGPVAGYVFATPAGYPVGFFADGLKVAGAEPAVWVSVPVDPRRVLVSNRHGITLYADLHVPRPDREIPVEPRHAHGDIIATDDALSLSVGHDWYIHAPLMGAEEFGVAMRGATISEARPSGRSQEG